MANGANAAGRTFLLDYPQQEAPIPQVFSPIEVSQEQPVLEEDPSEGLYHIQGVTDKYYQKFAKLRSFAQTMWKNYKIDVTAPDMSSDLARRSNQIYMAGLAELQSSKNDLKNQQKMFESAASGLTGANGQNIRFVGDQSGRFDPRYNVANIGMNDYAKEQFNRAKVYDSYNAADQTNQYREARIKDIETQINNTNNPAEKRALLEEYNGLIRVNSVYDPNRDTETNIKKQAEKRLSDKEGKIVTDAKARWEWFANIQNDLVKGDQTSLEFFKNNGGFSDAYRYIDDKTGAIGAVFIKPDGSKVKAPMNSDNWFTVVNEAINNIEGSSDGSSGNISWETMKKNRPENFPSRIAPDVRKDLFDYANVLTAGLLEDDGKSFGDITSKTVGGEKAELIKLKLLEIGGDKEAMGRDIITNALSTIASEKTLRMPNDSKILSIEKKKSDVNVTIADKDGVQQTITFSSKGNRDIIKSIINNNLLQIGESIMGANIFDPESERAINLGNVAPTQSNSDASNNKSGKNIPSQDEVLGILGVN